MERNAGVLEQSVCRPIVSIELLSFAWKHARFCFASLQIIVIDCDTERRTFVSLLKSGTFQSSKVYKTTVHNDENKIRLPLLYTTYSAASLFLLD